MNINIINNKLYRLFELDDVVVTNVNDGEIILVGFRADGQQVLIYKTFLSAQNNQFTLYDVRSLVESFLSARDMTIAQFTINVINLDETMDVSFYAIAGKFNDGYSAETLLHAKLLNSSDVVVTSIDRPINVNFLFPKIRTCSITFTALFDDGAETVTNSIPIPITSPLYNIKSFTYTPREVARQLGREYDNIKLLTVEIKTGEDVRTMTVFIHELEEPVQSFLFQNDYRTWEFLHVEGTEVKSLNVERGVAKSGHKRISFVTSTDETYKFTTAPLLECQEYAIEHLALADRVQVNKNGYREAVINNVDFEKSNDKESTNNATVSWQMQEESPASMTPQLVRIFNENYNNTFG